ncbi:MAG: hypothetical protein AAGL34_14760 [Bacteroidota bacterium]
MFDTLGSKVRIKKTPETEDKGLAGREGIIQGHTTPSIMDIEVIGTLTEDFAINVQFDELKKSYWFAEDLIEILDNGQGAEITIKGDDKKWIKDKKGRWTEEKAENTKQWWKFWK